MVKPMKFLTEESMDVKYLTEGEQDNKAHFIEGVFMQAEKPNRNGRMYPKKIMESQIISYQNTILERRSLGELGHPANPSVNLDKVSHLITELKFSGNDVIGKAKILDTPNGKIAQSFIKEGVKLGVSSRGLGSLLKKGNLNEVQNDFVLSTIDIVHEPSGIDCWVNGLMENAEWIYDSKEGIWKIAEQLKEDLKVTSSKDFDKKAVVAFYKFLNNL